MFCRYETVTAIGRRIVLPFPLILFVVFFLPLEKCCLRKLDLHFFLLQHTPMQINIKSSFVSALISRPEQENIV